MVKKFFTLLLCIALLFLGCASGMQQKAVERAAPDVTEATVEYQVQGNAEQHPMQRLTSYRPKPPTHTHNFSPITVVGIFMATVIIPWTRLPDWMPLFFP